MTNYEQKLRDVIGIFRTDMRKEGLFVAPEVKDKHWNNDSSFRYTVRTGLYRYLPGEVKQGSCVWEEGENLINNEGFLNNRIATALVDFRTEDYQEEGRKYKLTIPGEIENSATSLSSMAGGIRLLTSLERWAFLNAELERTRQSDDSTKGVDKYFILNPDSLLKR